MKRVAAFLLFTVIATYLTSGQTVNKETRDVKGFTKVNFGIPGNLEIKIGQEFSVVLEGEKNDLQEVITELSGQKLLIKQDNWRFNFNRKVNVYITMPELTALGVSGSGNAKILNAVKARELGLDVSGSGKILASEISAENLDCEISGSGNITLGTGNASNADVSISGSGSFSGDATVVKAMDISVSGSGNCTCNVTGSLKASISGSGNVSYKGDPTVDTRVSGSGHVRSSK
jgi:hypothetical protein